VSHATTADVPDYASTSSAARLAQPHCAAAYQGPVFENVRLPSEKCRSVKLDGTLCLAAAPHTMAGEWKVVLCRLDALAPIQNNAQSSA